MIRIHVYLYKNWNVCNPIWEFDSSAMKQKLLILILYLIGHTIMLCLLWWKQQRLYSSDYYKTRT